MESLLQQFALGNAAILTNVCMLPLYPGLIAFLAGNTAEDASKHATVWLGLLVLLGILTLMIGLGGLMYFMKSEISTVVPYLLPFIYLLVSLLGVMMFFSFNPLARIARAQAPIGRNPYLSAYLYGVLLAPMTLPCTGPIIVSAFVLGAASVGDLLTELLHFVFFGFGFGWPLLVLPLLAVPIQRRFTTWLAKNHRLISRLSGVLLIAIGIFGFITVVLPELG
ncbi:MAG: cytochrome c biogenesis protein CcdA [Aggregatilineales bacterium]